MGFQDQTLPDFAEMLHRLRLSRHYSLRALAQRASLDSTYLSRLEKGLYKPPKLTTLFKLARALDLEPDDEVKLIAASGRMKLSATRTAGLQGQAAPEPCSSLVHEGIAARQQGKLEEARVLLQAEVLPLLRRGAPSIEFAEALTALGDVYRVERKYDEAENYYLAAKGVLHELSEDESAEKQPVRVLYDAQVDWALAKISLAHKRVDLSQRRAQRAWRVLSSDIVQQEAGLPFAQAVCSQVLGRVAWARGDFTQAKAWLDASLAYPPDTVSAHTRAETAMYRVLLLHEKSDYFEVSIAVLILIAEDVLALARQGPFPHIVAIVTALLARLYRETGQTVQAEVQYREAQCFQTNTLLWRAEPDLFDLYERELQAAA